MKYYLTHKYAAILISIKIYDILTNIHFSLS